MLERRRRPQQHQHVGSGDGNTAQYAQGGGFLSPAVNVSALNGNLDGDGNFIL